MIIDIIYFRLWCFQKVFLMQFTFITSIWWNPNFDWIFNTQYKKIKLSRNDNFQVNSLPCHVFATNFLNIFPFAKPLKITTLNITLKRLQSHLNNKIKTTWHCLLAKTLLADTFTFSGLKCAIKPINSSLIYFQLSLNICIKTYIHFSNF